MSHLLADVPLTYVLVRAEFLHDLDPEYVGKFEECCIIGTVALEGRAPMFSAMVRNGALWARLPLHAFCTVECEALPLASLCLWDALSYDVTVHQYGYLSNLRVDVFCPDKVMRPGSYLFTLDWCKGDYPEMPDQHKAHHIIALDSGHLAAMPGNRLRWHEPSWIKPFVEPPGYKVMTHEFVVERDRALIDGTKQFYKVEGEQDGKADDKAAQGPAEQGLRGTRALIPH